MNELDHVSGDELTPSHDVLSAKLAGAGLRPVRHRTSHCALHRPEVRALRTRTRRQRALWNGQTTSPPCACRIEGRERPTCVRRSASRAGHEEGQGLRRRRDVIRRLSLRAFEVGRGCCAALGPGFPSRQRIERTAATDRPARSQSQDAIGLFCENGKCCLPVGCRPRHRTLLATCAAPGRFKR